ncbi:MAG: hypothetical protein CMG00_05765 [Candidatus Marinimicrobia bacterium]|nr:hypothetical protein [Candidatus Neomarinimicrobiota bacterium]
MNLISFIKNFVLENISLFIKSFLFFQILFVLFYFNAERIFESRADIMPSAGKDQTLISQLRNASFGGGTQLFSKSGNIYSSIIKSKSFSHDVFNKNIKINGQSYLLYDYLVEAYDHYDEIPEIESERMYRNFKNNLISVRYNKFTDIITIQTFTPDPYLSNQLLKVSLNELETRLQKYFINNVQAKKNFILKRISDIEDELVEIEDRYINFLKKNTSISSPNLVLSKKRLEREIAIKENILVQLAAELEIHKLEVTRDNHVVIDIIDEPSLNLLKVYPNFSTLLLLSLMISFVFPFLLNYKKFIN